MNNSHCPSPPVGKGIWREDSVIAMYESNSIWREVLPLGRHQHVEKGSRWTSTNREDNFSFLDKGLLRLSSLGENGTERIFLSIGAGCIFSELGCMDMAPLSTASFLAMTDCEVYHYPRSLLLDEAFTLKYPRLMMNLMQSVMLKAGAFFVQIEERVGLSPEVLVCRYLFRLQQENLDRFQSRISQSDLASALGLHRSTVCRILHGLRKKGILGKFTRTELEILNTQALKKLCHQGTA